MTVAVLALLAVAAAWVHGRLTGYNAALKAARDEAEVDRILGGVREVWNAPTSQLQEVPAARPVAYEPVLINLRRPRAITAHVDPRWRWDDELRGSAT